jgi:acetyl esterase/lipase
VKANIKNITGLDASGISIIAGPKDNLFFKYFVLLFIGLFLFISAGCNDSGSSDETSESSSSAAVASATWASLYSDQFPLYKGQIPGSITCDLEETTAGAEETLRYYNVSVPTLSVFLPPEDIATGAAVIICPGGGYYSVNYGAMSIVAEAMADSGIAAFILKYRLPNDLIMADKSIGPLQDAQEAIKTVRQRAAEWDIDPDRVGIMGQSAGGHVAALAGVHYDDAYIDNEEGVDLRPAFMILVSAVISMDEEITHAGSRSNLLGDDPDADLVDYFSTELQVTEDTPPAWIAHAENDTTVMVENSELFFDALEENGVPAELNLYATGNHSFVLYLTANGWFDSLLYWLETQGVTP